MAPRAVIVGCRGPTLGAEERAFLREADPWGFILFARNIGEPDQVRRLTASLREAVGREAPILVDQEGGRVARLRPPHWRSWRDPLHDIEALPEPAIRCQAMRLRYQLIAEELRPLGIDVNCAPLGDVARASTHGFLRTRCYGENPAEVAQIARAVAEGLMAGGVLPVLKHLPGHGRAESDSHADLPVVEADRATLDAADFLPFRALADLPLAMTAHVVFRAIDPERPATLSPRCIAVIREEIGFDNCLMTDDISMGALVGSLDQRAARALEAGCDLVLHCNADRAEMELVLGAVPHLTGQAAVRAERALASRAPASLEDPAALDAALAEVRRAANAG
jgi:beta-N-acetylhexosaminidase